MPYQPQSPFQTALGALGALRRPQPQPLPPTATPAPPVYGPQEPPMDAPPLPTNPNTTYPPPQQQDDPMTGQPRSGGGSPLMNAIGLGRKLGRFF